MNAIRFLIGYLVWWVTPACAFETLIVRYSIPPNVRSNLPLGMLVETLSRSVSVGTIEILESRATLDQERSSLNSIRSEVLAELRAALVPPAFTPVAMHEVAPSTVVVRSPMQADIVEFRSCARFALTTLKLHLQGNSPSGTLELLNEKRGNGAGDSNDGLFCGRYLGAIGGKSYDQRENIQLLQALSLEAPTAQSGLWRAFLAARHPQSPLAPSDRRCMEIWMWRLAYERVFLGKILNMSSAGTGPSHGQSRCLGFDQYSRSQQIQHNAQTFVPQWPDEVAQFASDKMHEAGI